MYGKKNVIARSKISSSKISTKRQIEDFIGNHSVSDITFIPLELDVSQTKNRRNDCKNPSIVEDASVSGQITTTTPPSTKIPDIIEDETQRKINKFIKGI